MKTKLVYVLTCAEEGTYIEQALISAYSARFHNPEAHIVLIVDDKTNELLVGKRAEVLDYVTEKVVVEVPSEYNLMQVSRWLKTSVRNIIDGDFLFIDCDTIITQSLSEIDNLECEIGASLDGHQLVSESNIAEQQILMQQANQCGWDFSEVEHYRSSGVIYVKDSQVSRDFYATWHVNYFHSMRCGLNIDQLSFEKTSQEIPIVEDMDGVWNTIMYARPQFIYQSKIIHFPSLNNNSLLFSKKVLKIIKTTGLLEYHKYYITHPFESFLPYSKYSYSIKQIFKTINVVSKGVQAYTINIDSHLSDLHIPLRISPIIKWSYKHGLYFVATSIWLLWIGLTNKHNPLEKYYNNLSR